MGTVIGVLSPGAMGGGLGRAWRAGGARVVTTIAGRSARTAGLADGLELLPDIVAVVASSDYVLSVVPPDQAVDVGRQLAAAAQRTGARPLVADLNATAPSTVDQVAAALADGGLELIDGSISGPPPGVGRMTTVYLSGPSAPRLAVVAAADVTLQVVGAELGLASAVKMCTASVYKGFNALLTQSLVTAARFGVLDEVLADLGGTYDLDGVAKRLSVAASKADRFVGEMREIAATQAAAGARGELFEAMAQVWAAVAESPLGRQSPEQAAARRDLAAVLADLDRPVS